MLDISLFRNEKDLERVKESERKRFKDVSVVTRVAEVDAELIKAQYEYEHLCKEINTRIKNIGVELKKKPSDKETILKKYDTSDQKETKLELSRRIESLTSELSIKLSSIGNILDENVPVSKTEDGNKTVREYHNENLPTTSLPFAELMAPFTNAEAGSAVFGHRGYFLSGKMAQLATALKVYAGTFLHRRGFTPIQTPVMMRKEAMSKTAQLSDFDEQLYNITDQELYLIATSEQPLTALFMNRRLTDADLPKMYAGESLCFRKEAGAHGKYSQGIFRVHQFEKIEQFVICKAEESNDYHEKMMRTAEEFYESLDIPYRTVLIASGEMNDAASKKYDLEAWFPNAQKFMELVSASNCTDYQSRNLNVYYEYAAKKGQKPEYVHMLNATLCAVQRTLCCIVENYQTEDGRIRVPDVLKQYVDFELI